MKKIYIFLILLLLVISVYGFNYHNMHRGMNGNSNDFLELKNSIISNNLMQGKYKCCLEKPCTYCIEKSPGHGEGSTCNCLADVVNGRHPCGECIGEILEGHGNKYLAEYFARAISEKTGEEDAIKRIIESKYGISVEDQY